MKRPWKPLWCQIGLKYQGSWENRAENSRNAANEYRENINRSVESINSAVGELSSTNQAIEHVKPIVKQHEQASEQTRSKNYLIKCEKKDLKGLVKGFFVVRKF